MTLVKIIKCILSIKYSQRINQIMKVSNSNSQKSQSSSSQANKQQLIEYFDRFFQTTLKQYINNPIILSEWVYFCTMLRSQPFDPDRVQLYLGILHNQNSKNTKLQSTGSSNQANQATHGVNSTTATNKPFNYLSKYSENYSQVASNSSNKKRVSLSPSQSAKVSAPLSNITNLQFDRKAEQQKNETFDYLQFNKKSSENAGKTDKSQNSYKTIGNVFEGITLRKTESSNSSNVKNKDQIKEGKGKQVTNETPLRRLNLDLQKRRLTDAAQALLKVFEQTHKTLR